MTDLRKAAEMALEALEHVDRFDLNRRFCFDEEIDALHAALAQGEQAEIKQGRDVDTLLDKQEPVAQVRLLQFLTDVVTAAGLLAHGKRDKGLSERISKESFEMRRIAAPPPSKQESVEYDSPALYKAKSEREQAEKQEPDAWLWLHEGNPVNALMFNPCMKDGHFAKKGFSSKPLYTAPPRKQEPWLWIRKNYSGEGTWICNRLPEDLENWDAVYKASPSKPWVSLTDDDKDRFVADLINSGFDFVAPIYTLLEKYEAALRSKNEG